MHVNCLAQKMRIMETIYYNEDGEVIEISDHSGTFKFDSCSPESIGESFIESVCAFVQSRGIK
jgi:hypothetical protein